MLVHAAELRFRKGLDALSSGRGVEALALFETAIELEKRHGSGPPQPRYLSFYGLCLAYEGKRIRDGVECCRQAVACESYNPDLFLNLGRACLAANRRRDAHDAFVRGLALAPTHADLKREIQRMGYRRRPPVPFLSRDNPINVALGKLSNPKRRAAAPRAETLTRPTRG